MDKKAVWQSALLVRRAIMHRYGNGMQARATSLGIDLPGLVALSAAYTFEPDPISVERLRVRVPYFAPAYYKAPLLGLKDAGYLDDAPEGGFYLNDRGHDAFRQIISVAYEQMNQLTLMPQEEVKELSLILARLVQAALQSPSPPCKWSIIYSRRLDPGRLAPAIAKLDQYLSDLAAYRDDAHLASWKPYSVSPHAWEILGHVWRRQASSVEEVLDKVRFRQWRQEQTRTAIDDLAALGWLEGPPEIKLTEDGKQVREQAEQLTDEYFFAPWDVVSGQELDRMEELFTKIINALSHL